MRNKQHKAGQKGSVLIAVLAIISLLAFLTTKFIDDSVKDLEYQALFKQPNDFRALAYNTLEITLAVIHEIATIDDGNIYHYEQGWQSPLQYFQVAQNNDWEIDITIQDPTGKISINTLNGEEMSDLLEEGLGFDFSTTQELKDAWTDWIDEDESRSLNGAESEDYESLNPPYKSANRPIQSLEELKLIQTWNQEFFDESGQPNDLFFRLQSMVTTLHDQAVNVNAASPIVLDYLLLNTSWDAKALFEVEDKPYITQLPESLNNGLLTTSTETLLIKITLKRGDVPFTINALVEKNFSNETSATNLPGKATNEEQSIMKEGTLEEQLELNFPFKILKLSENREIDINSTSIYSYSNLDILP
jgi:general secretion pathway protein K